MQDITINKEIDGFFIAICMQYGHSFVTLGCYNGLSATHLLARIGKQLTKSILSLCKTGSNARIIDEGLSRGLYTKRPISYQAYHINYEQYKEFIQLVEGIETDVKLQLYKPYQEDGNHVTLRYTSEQISTPRNDMEELNSSFSRIDITNTCRHTAIKIAEETMHLPVPSLASSVFFTELPYKTSLEWGGISKDIPFYVLPAPPPVSSKLPKYKKNLLSKLYHRMEHMLLIASESQQTQEKFQCLKNLYNKIAGQQEKVSVKELLGDIQEWRQEHHGILDQLREITFADNFLAFFSLAPRKAATTKMLDTIEDDLQSVSSKH